MECGIVILNYNSFELSCNLIKIALSINLINKIILVDNNSNDNFDSFINKINNKKVVYIKNKDNLGYATGNNIGLKYLKKLKCKYGFIANPDVIFQYNTIKNILDFLKMNQQYGVVSCTRTQNGTKKTGQFWTIPNYIGTLFESTFIGRKIQTKSNQKYSNSICDKSNNDFLDVEVVGGAFFGCNLDIMENVNYLDENTFLWYEENILSYKLKQKGYKVALLKTCTYEHNHKKSGHGNPNFKVFINSKRYFCKKYLKIGFLRTSLLYLLDFIGIVENRIICLLNKIIKKKGEDKYGKTKRP